MRAVEPDSAVSIPPEHQLRVMDVHIWLAETHTSLDPAQLETLRAVLTPEERARNDGMTSPAAQIQNLVGTVLARDALGRHTGVDPATWEFERGERGRPEITNPPSARSVRFNVAHTEGLVACAVTTGSEIGLDVESRDRKLDLLPFARRWFAPDEIEQIERLDGESLRDRFFSLWTLKEAYLKARGVGMARSPRHLSFSFPRAGETVVRFHPDLDDEEAPWRFALFHRSPGFFIATAIRSDRERDPQYIGHRIDPLQPGEAEPAWTLVAQTQR